jgi:hypothetical protein
VSAVTAEQLIGAHTGEQHLDAGFPGGLAHQHGVDCCGVANRLIKNINDPREHVDDIRVDLDLMQLNA